MLDCSPAKIAEYTERYGFEFWQLRTPLTCYSRAKGVPYGLDNGMFGGFRAMRQRGEDALATLEVLTSVLSEFPAWAIIRGCIQIAREKHKWAPNDGEIYDAVKTIVKLYETHCWQALALLDAPVEASSKPVPTDSQSCPEEQQASPNHCDGKHWNRIGADLQAREARKAAEGPGES